MDECEWCEPVPVAYNNLVEVFKIAQLSGSMSSNPFRQDSMVEPVAIGAVPVASVPVHPGERIDAIDVLRGIALFGVLTINVVNELRVSIFEEFLPVANTAGTLDRAVQTFLTMAIESEAMALFSSLFAAERFGTTTFLKPA